MSPRKTACVPWYRPHSSAPKVALMMKATSNERIRVRRTRWRRRARSSREALGLAPLLRVALHDRNRVQHLGGDRARVGDAVLAGARQPAHAAAEVAATAARPATRIAEHLRHHDRVGDDQHRHRADRPSRCCAGPSTGSSRRPSGPASCRSSGATAPRRSARLEELAGSARHVRVDRVAQVGGDALAEPGHHVEARRREHAERDATANSAEEVFAHATSFSPTRAVGGQRQPGSTSSCTA